MRKVFKIAKRLILLFLLLNMILVPFGKFQCKRMLEAIENNDINRLSSILKFANPNTVPSYAIPDIMSERTDKRTPLGAACEAGKFEMVKLLVEKGADVNYAPINALASPLGFAVQSKEIDNLDIVKFLIEKGADADYSKYRYSHPGEMALAQQDLYPNGMEILEALLQAGSDPEKKRLLYVACVWKHEEAIRYLIEEWGYDASDPRGLCAYCYGDPEYSYDTFVYFLEKGANPYEECIANKYQGEKCAIDHLKEESPEWAEKLIDLAAEYGFVA